MAGDGKNGAVPAGTLLIIGGAENKGEDKAKNKQTPSTFERLQILKTFIGLTGKEYPVIEIITSASSEGDESFEYYRKAFADLQINNVGHIHHFSRKQVLDDAPALKKIRR